ncbi:MAG: hypothetical protein RJA36_1412 [Pseudomonadota bacterium]|jgi:hypothetical protein
MPRPISRRAEVLLDLLRAWHVPHQMRPTWCSAEELDGILRALEAAGRIEVHSADEAMFARSPAKCRVRACS